jgi:hypothetical protein
MDFFGKESHCEADSLLLYLFLATTPDCDYYELTTEEQALAY